MGARTSRQSTFRAGGASRASSVAGSEIDARVRRSGRVPSWPRCAKHPGRRVRCNARWHGWSEPVRRKALAESVRKRSWHENAAISPASQVIRMPILYLHAEPPGLAAGPTRPPERRASDSTSLGQLAEGHSREPDPGQAVRVEALGELAEAGVAPLPAAMPRRDSCASAAAFRREAVARRPCATACWVLVEPHASARFPSRPPASGRRLANDRA